MNYRTYAKCMRIVFRKFGLLLSGIVAFIGVYSMAFSSDILDATLFKCFNFSSKVEGGLLRLLAAIILFALAFLLGLGRKFRIRKDHKIGIGLLQSYPILAVAISVLFVCFVINITGGNDLHFTYVWRLAFYMLSVGIYEELLFRGIIQNILMTKFRGDNWIIAVFLQAVVFGLCHAGNSTEGLDKFVQCMFSLMAGFFFGLTYYKTKSLLSGIILHAFYDFSINSSSCFLLWGTLKRESGLNWWSVVFSILLCVFFFFLRLYKELGEKKTYTLKEVEYELGLSAIREN